VTAIHTLTFSSSCRIAFRAKSSKLARKSFISSRSSGGAASAEMVVGSTDAMAAPAALVSAAAAFFAAAGVKLPMRVMVVVVVSAAAPSVNSFCGGDIGIRAAAVTVADDCPNVARISRRAFPCESCGSTIATTNKK
jgi:hypothetical protein